MAGDLYDGSGYSESYVDELLTYEYKTSDGAAVMVWQHAFDLRAFGKQGKENSSSTCEMRRALAWIQPFVMCIFAHSLEMFGTSEAQAKK